MKGTFDENTIEFYKELNGNCDPEKLLEIAQCGIYLYEPLLKYEKIKNHVYCVDISILAGQFFMVNNDEQYERFKYIVLNETNVFFEYFTKFQKPFNMKDNYGYLKLLIPNKYFIDKFLFEKTDYDYYFYHEEYDFKQIIYSSGITQEWLFHLYKYKYISKNEFINFYYTGEYNYTGELYINLRFFIFEYFYYGNKKYLGDLIEKSNIAYKYHILYTIIDRYMYDINILKYCANAIKKYNIYIKHETRLPLNFPLHILKKYTNALFLPNKLYVVYENKRVEDFVNSIMFDEKIEKNKLYCSREYQERYNLSENVLFCRDGRIINKNITDPFNKYNLYENNMKKIKSININYNYMNFLLNENNGSINKFELTDNIWVFGRDSKKSILCNGDKHYNNYDFFEKLLQNPNHIFEFKVYDIMYDKDRRIILLYYLASLFHNKIYNSFVIDFLLATVFEYGVYLSEDKFFVNFVYTVDYYRDLFRLIDKIPHEIFKQYFICYYEDDDDGEEDEDDMS